MGDKSMKTKCVAIIKPTDRSCGLNGVINLELEANPCSLASDVGALATSACGNMVQYSAGKMCNRQRRFLACRRGEGEFTMGLIVSHALTYSTCGIRVYL